MTWLSTALNAFSSGIGGGCITPQPSGGKPTKPQDSLKKTNNIGKNVLVAKDPGIMLEFKVILPDGPKTPGVSGSGTAIDPWIAKK